MRIVIIGAGIAGLSAAVGLAGQGIEVDVVEVNPAGDGTGAGITLLANALRALDELGVADPCLEIGHGFDTIDIADSAGNVLMSERPPRTFHPDRPAILGITRAALYAVLAKRAVESGATLRYEQTVTAIEQDRAGVDVSLSSGEHVRADLVVAADGTYSTTRASVFGTQHAPAYVGQGAWRLSFARSDDLDAMVLLRTATGRAAGVIPTGPDSCYVFVLETTAARARIPDEQLPVLMAERLAEFSAPILQAGAAAIGEHNVSYRPFDILLAPAPWHHGRVVLIGDAAHTLTPQMTSGGGLAIEDAAVLSRLVGSAEPIADILDAFSDQRYPRVKRVYDASLQISRWEQLASYDRSLMQQLMGETHAFLAGAF